MHLCNGHIQRLYYCALILWSYFLLMTLSTQAFLIDTRWRQVDHYTITPWTFNFVIDVIWEETQLFLEKNICILSRFSWNNTCYMLSLIACRFQIKIYKHIKFSIFLVKCNQKTFIYIKNASLKILGRPLLLHRLAECGKINYLLIKFMIK